MEELSNKGLTRSQILVATFIINYIEEHGVSPTIREIRNGLNMRSISLAFETVKILIRAGIFTKQTNRPRSLIYLGGRAIQYQNLKSFANMKGLKYEALIGDILKSLDANPLLLHVVFSNMEGESK